MERTKSRHFGAFGDSYPKVSPFSANKQTVKELVGRNYGGKHGKAFIELSHVTAKLG